MKKILITLMMLMCGVVYAIDDSALAEQNKIQSRIDRIGTEILNSNKFEKRVVFTYDENAKASYLKGNKALTKRQVVIYGNVYKYIETDDELAGFIAREIPFALRSYEGIGNGVLSSIKIKAAPKKYELVGDKLAVDYMVNAGYNPLGLIVLINKTCPQTRQDKFSNKNLTSKRLAYIYERIYTKYPYFLVNNSYIDNKYYQNFLLTSQENRKKVLKKVKNPQLSRDIKYE